MFDPILQFLPLTLFKVYFSLIYYIFQLDDGSKVPDKLEFWLHIREVAYLVKTNIDVDAYSDLLSSGLCKYEQSKCLPLPPVFHKDFGVVRKFINFEINTREEPKNNWNCAAFIEIL